jgi:hypothetical protein
VGIPVRRIYSHKRKVMHSRKELNRMKAATQEDIAYWKKQPTNDHTKRKLSQCEWFLAHLTDDYPEKATT